MEDIKEADEKKIQEGFEREEAEGEDDVPCWRRLEDALDRLERRGRRPAKVREPRLIFVNRRRTTYQFESVANNPWWAASSQGREWLRANWPAFRTWGRGWAFIRLVHRLIDGYQTWMLERALSKYQ